MSNPLLALNLLLVAAAVSFSIQLVRVFFAAPPLPPPPILRPLEAVVSPRENPAPAQPPLASYDVVASRNLFNPNRSDAITHTAFPAAKPVLYGVVINGDTRLAYLEDPATKRVVGYKTGDALAGGQLERIETDRVVIKRAEGPLEVMLNDPNKPKPAVSAPPPRVVRPTPAPPGEPSVPKMAPSAPEVPQVGGGAFR